MAIITRGKFRGMKVRISQFANNWVSIDTDNVDIPVSRSIFNITCLDYNEKEINLMLKYKNGIMWSMYEVKPGKKQGRYVIRKIKLKRK